jgi:hypothetical protein
MKNFLRTFKVFYIFLVLCFILVSISSGQKKGKNKGYWMDVAILPIDECTATESQSAMLEVDTRDGCKGALIPYTSKSIYINTLEHCFTLDELFPGSDIFVQKVEISLERDRNTGDILGGRFWLKDSENNYYKTEVFELVFPATPLPTGFSIFVNHCFEVKPQTGKGKKQVLGYLSVGTIEFFVKIR